MSISVVVEKLFAVAGSFAVAVGTTFEVLRVTVNQKKFADQVPCVPTPSVVAVAAVVPEKGLCTRDQVYPDLVNVAAEKLPVAGKCLLQCARVSQWNFVEEIPCVPTPNVVAAEIME